MQVEIMRGRGVGLHGKFQPFFFPRCVAVPGVPDVMLLTDRKEEFTTLSFSQKGTSVHLGCCW